MRSKASDNSVCVDLGHISKRGQNLDILLNLPEEVSCERIVDCHGLDIKSANEPAMNSP